MLDKQSLHKYLRDLVKENDSKVSRTAIETLLTIHRNILHNENDVRYRSIKPDNPNFNQKVWNLLSARSFMKKCGWIPAYNRYFFNSDEALVDIIEILLHYRNVQPQEQEWVQETKIITKNDEKLREEELRRRAAIERDKELAEYQKDKKYREDLAKKIHADIESDKRKRRELVKSAWHSGRH